MFSRYGVMDWEKHEEVEAKGYTTMVKLIDESFKGKVCATPLIVSN